MNRFMALIGVACLSIPRFAVATCEELRQRIADGMTAGGLTGFRLDIVPTEQIDVKLDTANVVGTCDANAKVILYFRAAAASSAAPSVSSAVATPQPSKPGTQLASASRPLTKPGRVLRGRSAKAAKAR